MPHPFGGPRLDRRRRPTADGSQPVLHLRQGAPLGQFLLRIRGDPLLAAQLRRPDDLSHTGSHILHQALDLLRGKLLALHIPEDLMHQPNRQTLVPSPHTVDQQGGLFGPVIGLPGFIRQVIRIDHATLPPVDLVGQCRSGLLAGSRQIRGRAADSADADGQCEGPKLADPIPDLLQVRAKDLLRGLLILLRLKVADTEDRLIVYLRRDAGYLLVGIGRDLCLDLGPEFLLLLLRIGQRIVVVDLQQEGPEHRHLEGQLQDRHLVHDLIRGALPVQQRKEELFLQQRADGSHLLIHFLPLLQELIIVARQPAVLVLRQLHLRRSSHRSD